MEQELWNHGFKNYIATLQNLAKDKKVCLNINSFIKYVSCFINLCNLCFPHCYYSAANQVKGVMSMCINKDSLWCSNIPKSSSRCRNQFLSIQMVHILPVGHTSLLLFDVIPMI